MSDRVEVVECALEGGDLHVAFSFEFEVFMKFLKGNENGICCVCESR